MKNLTFLFWCLALYLPSGLAQITEHSLAFGFYNTAELLRVLSNGNYVVIGRGQSVPGDSYSDTIFAVIINQQGDMLHKRRLNLPVAERHSINDVVALPDGGFVVSTGLSLCDTGPGESVVQRYSSTGILVWSREPDADENLCASLELSSDGNLVGTDGYANVMKLDLDNGVTIWEYPLKTSSSSNFIVINDLKMIPGPDNFIAVGLPNFQKWLQLDITGTPEYFLFNEQSLTTFSMLHRIVGKTLDFFYTCSDSTLYRFNETDTYETLQKYPFRIKDVSIGNQNLYILCKKGDEHRLVTTDLLGQIIADVALPINSWISAKNISVKNGKYTVTGINGSGPTDGAAPWLEYNAANLWCRTFTDPAALPSDANNAAIAEVKQLEPLTVTPFDLSGGQETRYKLEGGGFSIKVANSGQALLDKVDVLVGFEWNDVWLCGIRPVHRVHYTGLNLAPGESVWLDFGDVFADFQPAAPTELCFWTAAPNEKPDGNHDDDTYCHALLVGASEPVPSVRLHISPNPVADVLKVELFDDLPAGDWQLFNTTGQLVAMGSYAAGDQILKIKTDDFSNGLYILKAGSRMAKFVINH